MKSILFFAFYGKFFLKRLAFTIVLVLVLIVVTFFLIHLAPGDPVYYLAGQSGDEAYYSWIREKFGLNQSLPEQLWVYLRRVLGGDLGYSLSHQQPVLSVIAGRFPATLLLIVPAVCIASVAGVFLAAEAARRENSVLDRAVNLFALLAHSIPSFSIGLALLFIFALTLGWFPAQGSASARQDFSGVAYAVDFAAHLALPVLTLAIVQIGQIIRLTRTEMLNALSENFVTTARAKGLSGHVVVYRHALRNALVPVVTIVANDIGMLLSGAVLIETVFAYPGLGRLMLDSIVARDYPMLLGLFLTVSAGFALVNFLSDIMYPMVDPRIKYSQ